MKPATAKSFVLALLMAGLAALAARAETIPPPPPAFIVLFDANSVALNGAGRSVIAEAVKSAKRAGYAKVHVAGFPGTADTGTGPARKRAEAVRDELVRDGMDASAISVEAVEAPHRAAGGGKGVREPQNNRVVVTFLK